MKKVISVLIISLLVLCPFVLASDLSVEQVINNTFRNDSIGEGRKVVAAAATAEALASSQAYGTVTICAETNNTGVIAVGGSGVIASLTTREGVPLTAGSCITFQSSGDLANIYLDTTVNGDGVTYAYTN